MSRPFDGRRDGFVLGEGAGVLVLEELERAKQRGATIYAEVLGFGSSFDAYAVTKPDPEAGGAARAIACGPARGPGRSPATSTTSTPTAPARGSTTRWRRRPSSASSASGAAALPLSSIKSMIGHLIGAAGAVEAVALALTLHDGVRAADDQPDRPRPGVRSRLRAATRPASMPVRTAVSTSFGFGGQNAALVMQQWN